MCLLLSSYIQGSFRDPSVGKLTANLRPRSKDSKGPLNSRRPNLRRGAQALQCVDIYSSRKMNSSVPSVPHANYQLMQTQPAGAQKQAAHQVDRTISQASPCGRQSRCISPPQLASDHTVHYARANSTARRRLWQADHPIPSNGERGGRLPRATTRRELAPWESTGSRTWPRWWLARARMTAIACAALGCSKTLRPIDRTRSLPLGRKAESSSVTRLLSSAPAHRDSTNSLWTFASAWIRPAITSLRSSGISACESGTVACTVAKTFLARCSASRARIAICASVRFRSVMSRATFDAPTIFPATFLTGETVSEISIRASILTPPNGLIMVDALTTRRRPKIARLLVVPVRSESGC